MSSLFRIFRTKIHRMRIKTHHPILLLQIWRIVEVRENYQCKSVTKYCWNPTPGLVRHQISKIFNSFPRFSVPNPHLIRVHHSNHRQVSFPAQTNPHFHQFMLQQQIISTLTRIQLGKWSSNSLQFALLSIFVILFLRVGEIYFWNREFFQRC